MTTFFKGNPAAVTGGAVAQPLPAAKQTSANKAASGLVMGTLDARNARKI
jgi:hypothetical protein